MNRVVTTAGIMSCLFGILVVTPRLANAVIDEGRRTSAPSTPAGPSAPGEVIVKYRAGILATKRSALRASLGARAKTDLSVINAELLDIGSTSVEDAIARLKTDPSVEYAEPNYIVHATDIPNDSLFAETWGLHNTGQVGVGNRGTLVAGTPDADIDAPEAWEVFTGSDEILIGIIDTGIDFNHPDLAPNIWTNPGEIPGNFVDDDHNGYVDDVHGYSFAPGSLLNPMDDHFHGTHVAGTIGAAANNGIGVAGINWRCKMVAIKFLDSSGSGSIAGAITGLQYAIRIGVRVTNNSWGGDGRSQALEDAIAAAGAAGQLFVAAAGNDHRDIDNHPAYPAAYHLPNIITVAATDRSDSLAFFSNYGRGSTHIGAPGLSILSSKLGGGYWLLSGTSMAAPHVTGAIALLMGLYPDMDPLNLRDILLRSAEPIPAMTTRVSSEGRLNLRRMLDLAANGVDSIPPAPITDVEVTEIRSTAMALAWTASGDDGVAGSARRYDVRYSKSPITEENFRSATRAASALPLPPGSRERLEVTGLDYNSTYWFAVRALDEYGHGGSLSNTPAARTLGVPRLAVSEETLDLSLPTGSNAERTWTLRNDGEGILEYRIDPLQREPDPGASWVGGPDDYGYHWTDSDHGGPAFDWVDITGVGTVMRLAQLSDPVDLGMDFPFYGRTYRSLTMTDEGYLLLGDNVQAFPPGPKPIPLADSLPPAILPMWGRFYYYYQHQPPLLFTHNDGTRFIATWQWVWAGSNSYSGTYTFQAILYPDGEIRFQYLTLYSFDTYTGFSIGLQDRSGRDGASCSFRQPYAHPRFAVQLKPIPRWLDASSTSGRLAAGESAAIRLTASAMNLVGGSYRGVLPISCNDPAPLTRGLRSELHVTGSPRIEAAETVDLDTIPSGAEHVKKVRIFNAGQADLVVSRITGPPSLRIMDALPLRIRPHLAHNLDLRVRTSSPGTLVGTLSIETNDPAHPTHAMRISGVVKPSPGLGLDAEAVTMTTSAASRDTQHIVLRNTGISPLNFELRPSSGAGSTPGARAIQGYTWRTSDQPDGPKFDWIEVGSLSQPLANFLYSNGTECRLRLGFSFPFFSEEYDAIDVLRYGLISLRPFECDPRYTPLAPWVNGSAISEAIIASFWDDLCPICGGAIWFDASAERAVITWANQTKQYGRPPDSWNPTYRDVGPWTHQMILYPDGRIVFQYLWMYPATNSASIGIGGVGGALWIANNQEFVHHRMAVEFMPIRPAFTPEPRTGVIPPGGSQEVTLAVDAEGLAAGVYEGALQVRSDDPAQPQVRLPVILNAGVKGVIAPARPAIDFGTVYLTQARQETLRVTNQGLGQLWIESPKLTGAGFSLVSDPQPVQIHGRLWTDLVVRYEPGTTCDPCNGTIELLSNDPDHPTLSIPLKARGLPPPTLVVADQPIRVALAPSLGTRATTTRHTVVVRNESPTELRLIAGLAPERSAPARTAIPDAQVTGVRATRTAAPTRNGGESGYRWKDSDAPLGPVFEWQEISLIGSRIPITGDDAMSEPIEIGFSFPFFGRSFTSFRVSTNGFLTFSDTDNWVFNHALPNEYAAADMVAPLWDNLALGDASRAYVYSDGKRCVVSWMDVTDDKGKGSRTFQVILEPNGRIVTQYLKVNGFAGSATVGLQNATKDQAVTVVFDSPVLHDGMAIEIARPPGWLRSLVPEIVVPGRGESPVEVEFDATGLAEGVYQAAIDFSTNDPGRPEVSQLCELHVGSVTGELRLERTSTNARSRQKWLSAHLEPPAGLSPREISLASVRLQETVGLSEAAPSFTDVDQDGLEELTASFDRIALLAALPEGESVPVTATAEVTGSAWLSGTTVLQVKRPRVTAASGSVLGEAPLTPGSMLHLRWDDPLAASKYDFWFSPDGGTTWSLQADGLKSRNYSWRVPRAQTADGRVELVALDGGGLELGSWVSPALQVGSITGVENPLPVAFGIRMLGANPARSAQFELAIPRASRVQLLVYDVRGARIRTVIDGSVEPGWRPVEWDGRSDTGATVASGVYFARMDAEGQRFTQRLVIMR